MRLSALFVFGGLLLSSCEDEQSTVGLNLQTDADRVEIFQAKSLNYKYETRSADSVLTTNVSQAVFGSFFDPTFGKTEAEMAFQLRLPANNLSIENFASVKVDSVQLTIIAGSGYNSEKREAIFEVYELEESIADSNYYSTSSIAHLPEDLTKNPGTPVAVDLDKDYTFGEDSITGVIKIPLNTAWGEKILAFNGQNEFIDNEAFLATIKGLYVKENGSAQISGDGGLFMCNLVNIYSKVTIFYHDTLQGDSASTSLDLNISSESERLHFSRFDYSLGTMAHVIDDTTNEQDLVYVQSLGGLKATLEFPELSTFIGEDTILNKVELVLPLATIPGDTLTPTDRLLLEVNIGDTAASFSPDLFLEQSDQYFGGYYDEACHCYTFRITRYFQQVLNGEIESNKLDIVPSSESILARRSILRGKTNVLGGPQLYIYGTKF